MLLVPEQVSYHGHVISAKGIATKPPKVQKVAEGPTPQNISEVCQFVGLTFYYQCFVRILLQWLNCSMNSAECQKAFEDLKVCKPVLVLLGLQLLHHQLLAVVEFRQ